MISLYLNFIFLILMIFLLDKKFKCFVEYYNEMQFCWWWYSNKKFNKLILKVQLKDSRVYFISYR